MPSFVCMLRMPSFVCMLLLLCSGCAYQPMTEIRISPNFSPEETAVILDATMTWFEKAPELRMPVYIGEGGILKRDCSGGYLGSTLHFSTRQPEITICAVTTLQQLHAVTLHELGHAFAGEGSGHLDEGNIMSPDYEEDVTELTAADIAYVRR